MRIMLECVFKGEFEKFHKEILNEITEKFNLIFVKETNLPTHVTLKYSFEVQNIKDIENTLDKFVSTHKKAELYANKFSNFNKDTIFIEVNPSVKAKLIISDLIKTLKEIPWISWNKYDGEDIYLHTTIAEEAKEKYKEIEEYIKNIKFNFELWLDNISILEEIPSNSEIRKWKISKTYYLN